MRKLADYQREKRKMKHRQPYKTFPLLTSNRLGSNYFFTEIKKKILYTVNIRKKTIKAEQFSCSAGVFTVS